MKSHSGFSLIELLVVLAIIGILGSIAFINYAEYLVRSRVAEAHSQLADLRVKMEQYYQDNRNYGSSATTCGLAMPATGTTVKYFTYTCNWGATATNQGFRITAQSATGAGLGAAGDYTYTIDQDNAKATTKFNALTRTDVCWISTKGQSC
ncbi:MAG: type IV pilin protein [Pseudomonadota bacterium]